MFKLIFILMIFTLASSSNEFIENNGQIMDQFNNPNKEVLFVLKQNGYRIHIKRNTISYEFINYDSINKNYNFDRIDLVFESTNHDKSIIQNRLTDYKCNFYLENKAIKANSYKEIIIKNIYNKVDLIFTITNDKFDFYFKSDNSQNLTSIDYNIKGNEYFLKNNKIKFEKIVDNEKNEFRIVNNFTINLPLKDNNNNNLLSNKNVAWGTYIGGEGYEDAWYMDSELDNKNNLYFITTTSSTNNIATLGAFQTKLNGSQDAYVCKIDKNGIIKWSTYIGGDKLEKGESLALFNNQKLYICGATSSKNNIASQGVHQNNLKGSQNAFIIELNLDGEYQKGTYFGGNGVEEPSGLGVDNNGNIYISGYTTSTLKTFASTNAYQEFNAGNSDMFVGKFDSHLNRIWSTYLGDNSEDVVSAFYVDENGESYITGYVRNGVKLATQGTHQNINGGGPCDTFIFVFDKDGNKKIGTLFGGNGSDWSYGIKLDKDKNIYITGFTNSTNNIATKGAFQDSWKGGEDCFVAKFDNSCNLLWATYLGGIKDDRFWDLDFDKENNLWLSGNSMSELKVSDDAIETNHKGERDILIVNFTKNGEMLWQSYLGGVKHDFGRKINYSEDGIYISGITSSISDISTLGSHQFSYGGGELDNFVIKLGENRAIPSDPCENSSFNFKNFKSINGLNLLNDAVRYDSVIRLTKADYFQKGIVWSKVPFDISKGFKSDFTFELSEGNNFGLEDGSLQGADGIVFLISGNPANKVGYAGGGIAFEGLSNAIAIELDLYKNEDVNYSDPNGNHIAMFASKKELNSDHNSDNLIKQNTEIEEIQIDKTRYQISIDYEAKDGTFKVFLNKYNSSKKIALEFINFDIENYIDLIQGNSAYFGIAAATGNSVQRHELFSWNLCAGDLISSVESNYNEILAFPNPNNGFITIDNLDSFKSIAIVDILGNSIDYKINSNIIDISDSKPGTYFLKLVDLNNELKIQKIIKY